MPKQITIKIHNDHTFEVVTKETDLEILIIDQDGSKVMIKDGKAQVIKE